jgi:cellulose synthase/poly-beta-1,6-N-acetylglucosamine synthase-like glycosyltransferase
LIAARNEQAVLPYLLESLRGQDYPAERIHIYVVADNCTDDTARAAAEHGATVYSRFNRREVGKGYALNYLLERIKEEGSYDSYDAFLVFDADNLLKPDYVSAINRSFSDGFEAVTGYRNTKNFSDSWVSAGYGIWFMHDSVHLNQSRMLLGTTCAVSGTGFGFTRGLLERCGGWRFHTLTEDVEFDTWCATNGVRIGFCRDAMLYDEQPASFAVSWRQRTRWVQGGVQIAFRYTHTLLRSLFRGGATSWASYENISIGFWGFLFSGVIMAFSLLTAGMENGWTGVLLAALAALRGGFLGMFGMSFLTTVTQWKYIEATAGKKILYMFTFPLFMLSYVPIGICAIFCKFEWSPIAHTVAVPFSAIARRRAG